MYQPNRFQAPPDGILDSVLDEVDNTERAGSQRTPRLGLGQHRVSIARYYGYESQRGSGTILNVEVIVEKSTAHAPGERRLWQYFPRRGSVDAQKFERTRIMDFNAVVDMCLGMQPRGNKETGRDLASGRLRGLTLDVNVFQATKRDKQTGAEIKLTNKKDGGPVMNAQWSSIQQTLDQVKAKGASLPADPPLPQAAQYVPSAATQPQYAPPQYQQRPQYAPPHQGNYQPQYQQAPAPAQPAPQYAPPQAPQPQYAPPQAPQPQYAPPQAPAPQYAPQPQPQYAPQPAPAPAPQYASNPYAPQAPQGQPMQSIFEGLKGNGA